VDVDARFASAVGAAFTLEPGAADFASDVHVSVDGASAHDERILPQDGRFVVPQCAAGPCRLRYRVALKDAAVRLDDVDRATDENGLIEAPPSTWLLLPEPLHEERVRFRMSSPREFFATGVAPSADEPTAWELSADDLRTSPYSAFGEMRIRAIPVEGGTIQLAIGPGKLALTHDQVADWTVKAARCVSLMFGRFPMPGALVLITVGRGRWIGEGRTLAGGGGSVFVRLGEAVTSQALNVDWVLVHEMIHLGFPSVPRENHWAEEGLATYIEPFARVRAGLLNAEEAWKGLVDGLPNGLPASGDAGLDHTPTWGRTYWGGALFWLLADIEIRERSKNQKGLEDALVGLQKSGGTNAVRWSLERALETGDAALGMTVLRDLHEAMRASPYPVDLAEKLRLLGVKVTRQGVRFNDAAPLAHVRQAITFGSAHP
jgi:predicted metalloprotease with PDZ domain